MRSSGGLISIHSVFVDNVSAGGAVRGRGGVPLSAAVSRVRPRPAHAAPMHRARRRRIARAATAPPHTSSHTRTITYSFVYVPSRRLRTNT